MKTDLFITPGRHPTIPEIRSYYSRPDILNELLQGMQHWHIRYVPGYERQTWLYTESAVDLLMVLEDALDTIAGDSQYTDYPYFRINHARYSPAYSWDSSKLWGYDFVIEKDSPLWQECFEAMLPVMDIMEHFGVYYWLKYSGHHSLHLIIPAEVFPQEINGILYTQCHEALYHRLMIFLNRHANQHYNEHNRHCPPGTNMPYSVNEDTGLVNLPLRREDLAAFRPWHASIHLVKPRDFWRNVPENVWGQGEALLDEVLKPTRQQKRYYTGGSQLLTFNQEQAENKAQNAIMRTLCLPTDLATVQLESKDEGEKQRAAWSLMITAEPESVPHLIKALSDRNADVRWFGAEGLVRVGTFNALQDMLEMAPDDMAGSCMVDFCVRLGEMVIPALIQALSTLFRSPYSSLPYDKALVRLGKSSIPYVKDLLNNKKSVVRHVAADVMDRISGTPTAEEVLHLSKLHNKKAHAASMLGWFDDAEVYTQITELFGELNNDKLRRECVKSLLWNDHPETEKLLHIARMDSSKKIRGWAERYLAYTAQLKLMKD